MSVGVVAGMFGLAYLPQVALLAFVSGPLGWYSVSNTSVAQIVSVAFIAAVPLVLGEAFVVVNFLTRTFLLGQVGIDLFDSVSHFHV